MMYILAIFMKFMMFPHVMDCGVLLTLAIRIVPTWVSLGITTFHDL